MNLSKKNILLVFLGCLSLTIILPALLPTCRINAFAPFLVILFYRKPLIICLWVACGCGLILDLLSPYSRLGLHAVNFTLTSALLYHQKKHFFADSLTTLPLMTYFFSLVSTLGQFFLLVVVQQGFVVSAQWVIKDLVLMPGVDALIAFTLFILPFIFLGKPIRKGKEYFLQENEVKTEGSR